VGLCPGAIMAGNDTRAATHNTADFTDRNVGAGQGRIQEKHRLGGGAVPQQSLRKFGPKRCFRIQYNGAPEPQPLLFVSPGGCPVSQPNRCNSRGGISATTSNIYQGTAAMQDKSASTNK